MENLNILLKYFLPAAIPFKQKAMDFLKHLQNFAFSKNVWRLSSIIYSWTMAMAAMEVEATVGFLGVSRRMGVISEAVNERFLKKNKLV